MVPTSGGWEIRGAEAAGDPVDFELDGLGNPDQPLAVAVDTDRIGQADLLVTDDTIDVGRILGLPLQMQLLFAIAQHFMRMHIELPEHSHFFR